VTVGATEALSATFNTLLNPGDEVIIPTPAFGLYESITRLCRGVPVFLPTEDNGFQIDPAALAAALTPRTKAIILTSPNNPTGCMYSKETLDAIHAVLKDRPVFVICNDVYRTLTYADGYHSFAEYQDMRDRIVVVQSFSKPYAMTGWRVGYLLADKAVKDRLEVFHQYAVTSVPAFIQPACVKALESAPPHGGDLPQAAGLHLPAPDRHGLLHPGAPRAPFYVFVDVRKYGMDSITFCERMLRESLVGAIPGIYFAPKGYIRLSLLLLRRGPERGPGRIER
jgi:aminotransferase